MKPAKPHSENGIAIVIVMVCIFILAALTAVFAAYMKVELRLAQNSNNEAAVQWVGRSGVERARWILGSELTIPNQPYDSLNQFWSCPDCGCDTNNVFVDVQHKDVEVCDGKFTIISITDAESKFNINLALGNDALLQQAMILIGVDAAEIPTIIASIQDWIDRDDNTRVNGAESEFYQAQNPPYFAKNGPIDDLSELLFVKGVTPEIYWGPHATNHPMMVFQSRSPLQSGLLPNAGLTAGLNDIFTPISSGRININTATTNVLQMIPGIDANMAAAIVRMRSGPDGVDRTCDDVPLTSVGELVNIGLSPVAIQALSQYCDVRSSTFEAKIYVEVGPSKRYYYALLKRNGPKDVQILNFRWKDVGDDN